MAKSKPACCEQKAKIRLFGPGTIVALLGVGAIIVYNFVTAGSEPKILRTDSRGNVYSVTPVSDLPESPGRKLVKPEPSLLLEHGVSLDLSADQQKEIRAVAAEWKPQKERLLKSIEALASGVQDRYSGEAKPSTEEVSGSLQEFSAASRTYDRERARYWHLALAQLSPKQEQQAATLLKRLSKEQP